MMIGFVVKRATAERYGQPGESVLQLARDYLNEGEASRAEKLLTPLQLTQGDAPASPFNFTVTATLAESYLQQGRLHLAAATYHPLLDRVAVPPRDPAEFSFLYGLCDLYYEWGRLGHVQQYLSNCLTAIDHQKLPRVWAAEGYLRLAWSLWATGRDDAAARALRKAAVIARQAKEPGSAELVRAHQATFRLRHNDISGALRQLALGRSSAGEQTAYGTQFTHTTLIRLSIAQGDSLTALRMLDRYLPAAAEAGRGRDVIEFLVLQALAYQVQGNLPNATAALAEALCRAEREEYIRTFLDEGLPLAELLRCSAAQGVTLAYVKRLLAAFFASPPCPSHESDSGLAADDQQRPIEPLTQREMEVLRLVAGGYSNRDIASRLSIATSTVKKHLGNIFAKLGARNRTQAAARAHELKLV